MFDFLLTNDTLSAVIAFVLVLIPAVLIHEFGHFLAAKAVGITILEFGIGMPPRMVRLFRIAGTDYTLNWLPLGGFVRPIGEDLVSQKGDDVANDDRDEALKRGISNPKSVSDVPPLQRIVFMAAGAVFNFIMAILLFMLVGVMGVPVTTGGLVDVISLDSASPLASAGIARGDVILTVDGVTATSADEALTRLSSAETPMAVAVARGEETLTLTVDPLMIDRSASTHAAVGAIAPGSPADVAGLQPLDVITALDGIDVASIAELQALTRERLGQEVEMSIWRAGETLTIRVTPRVDPPAGEGAIGISIADAGVDTGLGIAFREGFQRTLESLPPGEAIGYGFGRFGDVIALIASVPGQIFRGTADPESLRVTSPLGISQIGAVFLQESIERSQPSIIVEFVALISIALGLTNLLPIPALDGGRIVFVLIEIVRGRPIAPEREGMVHMIGLAVLLSLMVVVLFNDIINPLTNILR